MLTGRAAGDPRGALTGVPRAAGVCWGLASSASPKCADGLTSCLPTTHSEWQIRPRGLRPLFMQQICQNPPAESAQTRPTSRGPNASASFVPLADDTFGTRNRSVDSAHASQAGERRPVPFELINLTIRVLLNSPIF